MKKIFIALCSVAIIFTYNFLTPMAAIAAESSCPPHTFSATHYGSRQEFLYSHAYEIPGGSSGPTLATCHVYHKYEGLYPRCPICGFIDYENAYWETDLGIVHDACGN